MKSFGFKHICSLILLLSLTLNTAVQAQVIVQSTPVGSMIPGRYLVFYRNTVPSNAEVSARLAGGALLHRNHHLGVAVIQTSAVNGAKVLQALPDVTAVVADRVVSAQAILATPIGQRGTLDTADSLYASGRGWAVRQVGGYGAQIPGGPTTGPWDTTEGKGVRIAILDSGVDASHPDLAPNLAVNLSEIDQTAATGQPSPCDDGSPQDQQGHGSWVASLAAGALGSTTGEVVGVAPAATLLNVKVLERMPATAGDATTCAAGQASGLLSWVIQGIDDAVAQHADIICMSLGTLIDLETGDGAVLKAAFDQVTYAASKAGVILIASVGNDGFDSNNQRYFEIPAQSRGVLAIVATTNPDCAESLTANAACVAGPVTMPYYSNRGGMLNALAAPGGSYPSGPAANPLMPATVAALSGWIEGACSSGKPGTADGAPGDASHSLGCFGLGHVPYVQAMGTSASAPLAAGAAALIRAAHPAWPASSVIAAMRSSATPLAGLAQPLINAAAAVALP